MVDGSGFLAGVSGAAVVQGAILMIARRWLGRVDAVEADLKDIKEQQMKKLEKAQEKAAESRQGIHQQLAAIQATMVDREALRELSAQYVGHVRELAQVTTRIEAVARESSQQTERLAAVTADVNRILGRMGLK